MIESILASDEVRRFLASSPRHRLLVVRDSKSIPDGTLDLGLSLAQWIKSRGNRDSHFSFDVQSEVFCSMADATFSVSGIGTVIPVSNIGILFEPALGLTPEAFLARFSKNDILVLFWSGTVKGNRLYLPDDSSNCTIDLTEINHLVI